MPASSEDSFADLLAGLKAGSQTAAEEVFRVHYRRIVALIRQRIGRRYQAKIDADSIVNSTLKTFFRRYTGDRLALSDWQELWNLLVAIARNKLNNRLRRLHQQKRDAGKEVGAEALDWEAGGECPEEAVVVADLLDAALAGYAETARKAIEMSLQGYTVAEIAAALGVTTRTVIRFRKDFQRRLEAMRAADEESE